MRLFLLNRLTALSLLLFAAAGTLWVRGARSDDSVAVTLGHRFDMTLVSHRGRWLVVTGVSNPGRIRHELTETVWSPVAREWLWHERAPAGETPFRYKHGTVMAALPPKGLQALGEWSAPMPAFELASPTWPLVVATAVLPVAWLTREARAAMRGATRWRRFSRGRCTSCGYDLRGIAGRCPECGELRDEPVQPFSMRVVSAVGGRATLLGGWSVVTAAIGVCARSFDDPPNEFPGPVQTALAVTGVLCGVIAGVRAAGAARVAGVLGALVNLGLLCVAFLPRINR